MTRINFGIPVRHLTDEHLLAEHREIKRISDSYIKALKSGSISNIPHKFCLGSGHVLFFIDKPAYTLHRYKQLYRECIRRGFNVQSYSDNWNCYSSNTFKRNITPTSASRDMIIERISDRIKTSPKKYFHYWGEKISKRKAIQLLIS